MAEQVKWRGESGKQYDYWVYPINTTFKDEPGNYIYAKRNPAGNWQAVYIGQTSSLSQRLATHEKEQSVIRHGGATHILAHLSTSALTRRIEEADLIKSQRPPFNETL
jgi:predicted GIY-YIG superfamily endonuclease